MKIEHLCYLREIAKCRSISSAAKRLYIGQTTLSAIIKSLEEELGVQIFLRTSSGVQLTKEGERVLELSEDMIGSYNEMLHGFQRGASPEKRVHFLCDTTMSRYFSVQLIKAIQLCNREASIVFHEVERQRLLTSLLDGIANIGVTSMDMSVEIEGMQLQAERNGVEVTLLGVDKFYLCVRADHPRYAHRTSVDVNELMDERYIAPQHYSTVSNGVLQRLPQAQLRGHPSGPGHRVGGGAGVRHDHDPLRAVAGGGPEHPLWQPGGYPADRFPGAQPDGDLSVQQAPQEPELF